MSLPLTEHMHGHPPLLQLLACTSQGSRFYSYSPDCPRNVGRLWGISSLLFQTEMELNGFCFFLCHAVLRGIFNDCEDGGGELTSVIFLAPVFLHLIDVYALS